MIRHLFKLIWNRKRSNFLLGVEIFVSFLVLFAVCTMTILNLQRYTKPMGFEWNNVYSMGLDWRDIEAGWSEDLFNQVVGMLDAMESMDEVESVCVASPIPFGLSMEGGSLTFEDREINARVMNSSDKGNDVFNMNIIQGRWFSENDEALDYNAIIVNSIAVEELFEEGVDPIGKIVHTDPEYRIVGVVDHFRHSGRYSRIRPMLIRRVSTERYSSRDIVQFAVLVKEGTTADFEGRATEIAQRAIPNIGVNIEPLENVLQRNSKFATAPVLIVGIISAFLMIMVILGMLGVFWQNVTARTDELGLRRALGSSRKMVYRQLIFEIMLITLIACFFAIILVVQLPLLGILPTVGWDVVLLSTLLTLIFMTLLSLASGLYPAWLAAKIEPAQALHYE